MKFLNLLFLSLYLKFVVYYFNAFLYVIRKLNDLKFDRAASEMNSTVSKLIGKDRNENKTNKY
jgi:hypothetical protein